ncbi:MAG: cyclase family protein [Desulfomonilaceae bacterium]|nr:cyclase family protein [Desulfomonilaceae bacterium]
MPLFDATLPIRRGMLTFPGDPPFETEPVVQRRTGGEFNLARISMGTHLGTHVDPPAHYLEGGATADLIPLDHLVGPGIVLDMTGRTQVDRGALENSALGNHVRVLFKTDNSPRLLESEFHEDYVHLTEDGAAYLIDRGILMVGNDYLSIERYGNPGAPVHMALLKAGVLIVEGVHLLHVPVGPCEIFCLPLRIQGADGAPARVVIRT